MSLFDIGAQCSHSPCKEIDFLPILCRCQHYFCRAHSPADAHGCTYTKSAESLLSPPGPSTRERCAVDKCTKPSLESFIASDTEGRTPATCSHCKAAFCAEHRHPKSHSCQITPSAEPKNEAARALLAKNFPSTSRAKMAPAAPRAPKIPTDPVKLAQFRKIELMKMRHRAVPVDPKDKLVSLPQDDRLHIKVPCDDKTEKVFWVRKSLGTGRVLDLLAGQLGLSSDSSPLELLKVSGTNPEDRVKCRNDQVFSKQVEEGSTLVVSRCTPS
ncbi:hypothetical protein DFH07DRAFT_376477 [Mycena maculata]|uniref:AN1-type domain-containing protein n=1 Tax=Mycena maculata TaxID=230809 RepID=A0AAD7JGU8_9AGAR|nr:hypothetical protein DFH07DRAFT_376477 [Mycena maculata]